VPCTGGTFIVSIITSASASETGVRESVLWDRRVDGGFPGMLLSFFLSFFLLGKMGMWLRLVTGIEMG
jgi:hypothetical protein